MCIKKFVFSWGPHSHDFSVSSDFGDWWSHTIIVSKYDGSPPEEVSIAHLLSGSGACPPEDSGGIEGYTKIVSQLCGKLPLKNDDNEVDETYRLSVSPISPKWWGLMNSNIRSSVNADGVTRPFDFDIEHNRLKLARALRSKRTKSSVAFTKWSTWDTATGLTKEIPTSINKTVKDPTKFCAVCNVTVALKICSGCKSIAFCNREHQLQFWPQHKADCKKISKQSANKKSK